MTPILRVPRASRRRTAVPLLLAALAVAAAVGFRHHARFVVAPASVVAFAASADPGALPVIALQDVHSLDMASTGSHRWLLATSPASLEVRRGAVIAITGWAVDATAREPSAGVYATLGNRSVAAHCGLARPDVAHVLANSAYTNSGFQLDLDTSTLAAGRHAVVFHGIDAQGTGRYDFHRTITITVLPASARKTRLRSE